MKRLNVVSRSFFSHWAILALGLAALLPNAIKAEPKGELVVAQPSIYQRYNPLGMVSMTDLQSYNMLFDGLINLGPKGKYPALAESWTTSKDGKEIIFNLRHGVKFHNGEEMTSEDVKFTFEYFLRPDSTHSYRKAFTVTLKSVDVLGRYKVRFNLKQPFPLMFTSARQAYQAIVPKKYYEKVGEKGFLKKPIGTGPFKLHSIKRGEWSKFEAHTEYWGQVSDVKYVTKRLVGEPLTRYAQLVRGEADIIQGVTGPLLEKIKQDKSLRVVLTRYSGKSSLLFHYGTNPEFKDRRVRLAVAHAIDRKGINDAVLGGVCELATHDFTPATFGHNPNLKLIPYDPAKARKLLAQAGIKKGIQADFIVHTQSFAALPNAPRVLEAIAGNLEAVGFKLKRIPMETGSWLKTYRAKKQTGIFYAPSSIPDDGGALMNSWYTSSSKWNGGQVNVPEYDEIYAKQAKEMNSKKREALLREFAELEAKNLIAVPLFWCSTPFGVGPRVKSWTPGLGSGYHMNLHLVKMAQ